MAQQFQFKPPTCAVGTFVNRNDGLGKKCFGACTVPGCTCPEFTYVFGQYDDPRNFFGWGIRCKGCAAIGKPGTDPKGHFNGTITDHPFDPDFRQLDKNFPCSTCKHTLDKHLSEYVQPVQGGGKRKSRKSKSPVKGTRVRKALKAPKALKVVRHRSTKKRAVRRSSPKGSLTVSVSKVMKSKRFTLACRGHSRIRGGLNSADIMRIAKRLKVSTRGTRVEVLRRICKKYGKKTSWTTVSAPKGKARHLLKYHCGAKCFLMPKEEKFPICPDYTVSRKCKPSCRGLLAAKRRASEWHYAGVRSKAVAMMKRMKCKSKSKSKKSKKLRVAGTKLMK